MSTGVRIEVAKVSFSYFDGLVLQGIDMNVNAGEMVALLGPNGSGKTTLLKLASGVLKPGQGEVRLGGDDIGGLRRRVVASQVAVVPQQFHVPFAFTVNEVITLGRMPFIRGLSGESTVDRLAVTEAMALVGVSQLSHRRFDELSGGERQKVVLAMALAQQPKLLLLDEPTLHLDITHQVDILELVRQLNRESGLTVIAAMHDLNLAALYFDRLVLLEDGRIDVDGTPVEVLTEERIKRVFTASVRVEHHPLTGGPHVMVVPRNGDSATG